MTEFEARRTEVIEKAAAAALRLPLQSSGLWFHGDMRDNLYFALHLYLASCREDIRLPGERGKARKLAEAMLLRLLRMQQRDPQTELYGHWPLALGSDPDNARPHPLPVELVGNLLSLFAIKYKSDLSETLKTELHTALSHVYRSRLYADGPAQFHHHDAKRCNLQLMLAVYFNDAELHETAVKNLDAIRSHVEANGFHEYGALPWFWHWIQAFTCSWEVSEDSEAKRIAGQTLAWLWDYRARCYLKGAWIGPHSRVLPHDTPSDRNTLFDYVQFGDFGFPADIARLEGAGLFSYRVSPEVMQLALDTEPTVWEAPLPPPPGQASAPLHQYIYRTGQFAVGGVLEYAEEYLNEQHRWDVTFPASADGAANQAFFFHPGKGYEAGGARQASRHCEVLLHRTVVAALYPVPDGDDPTVVGFLPHGVWSISDKLWVGDIGSAYLAVHMRHKPAARTSHLGMALTLPGRGNGVVLEVIGKQEAEEVLLRHRTQSALHAGHAKPELGEAAVYAGAGETTDLLAALLANRPPQFESGGGTVSVAYRSLAGDRLTLHVGQDGTVRRTLNDLDLSIAANGRE
ncbi:hypothetical protein [Paenibacillus contaminans]|uniref:Heparinase n=1 Tax=Paenibacillus contaminans TaxID=450362 RepID=A0A329MHT5_9BACL|nr:hypothetical protein [Paenibacillus contaminans]RAV19310.1 hypothetical protein DQG23_20130 [Paenibacillus contaminans]